MNFVTLPKQHFSSSRKHPQPALVVNMYSRNPKAGAHLFLSKHFKLRVEGRDSDTWFVYKSFIFVQLPASRSGP